MVKKSSFTRMARWGIMEVYMEGFAMKCGGSWLIVLLSAVVLATQTLAGCESIGQFYYWSTASAGGSQASVFSRHPRRALDHVKRTP